MAIEKLFIRRFRSIDNIELRLGRMNALVGPNNSGKSNILRALNIVLGETYPSPRSFTEKDFFSYDASQPIQIDVRFSGSLQSDPDVWGFSLKYDGRDVEFEATDQHGARATYRSGQPKRVKNEMRDEVALLYLGLNRQAEQQLRATQWTLYGKLLRHIQSTISATDRSTFRDEVSHSVETHINPSLQQFEDTLNEFVRRQTGLELQLSFAALDPVEVLKTVRPYVREPPLTLDPEDVGAGTQSAIAIAIARAYANIVRRPLTLCIEEPELYLHPHGCRHFYRLLVELAREGVQVVYATHERSFVDVGEYESIHLVRKSTSTTVSSGIGLPALAQRDRLSRLSKFDERINEAFFAHCVVLTEGPTDEIACKCALEKLGVELDKESVSVLGLGSKGDLPVVAELLQGLSIPAIVLMDEDPGDATTQAVIDRVRQIVHEENLFLQRPRLETVFGLTRKPSRADALDLFPAWFAARDHTGVPSPYPDLFARCRTLLRGAAS